MYTGSRKHNLDEKIYRNMKLKRYLFCLVITICISSCRTRFIPNNKPLDNIVLITGDTLYGKVDYFDEGFAYSEFDSKIRLIDTMGRKRRFKRKKILSYRIDRHDYESFYLSEETRLFKNGRLFSSKYYIGENGNQHFLKVIAKGKLSHYKLEWIDYDNNLLESSDLIKKSQDKFFIHANNTRGRIAIKTVSAYLSNCKKAQEKIIEKDIKYVSQFVVFYNQNCE